MPRCQLNTHNLLLPLVPLAVPLPHVLDPHAMPDPPPVLDLLPTPREIMSKIKRISSSPWPSPCRRKRTKCPSWAPWAPQSSEEWISPDSWKCTKASRIAQGPSRGPRTSSQPSHTTPPKPSRTRSKWRMDIWRRTGSSRKRNWRTSSAMPIAGSICRRDRTWSDYAKTSWNVGTSSWKPLSSPPQHQPQYDQHGSHGRVLTSGNVARSPHKSFENQSSNETQTTSEGPLDFQVRQTPNSCRRQMCERRWHCPCACGTSTYSTRGLSLPNPFWSSAPTDVSSGQPSGNP